MFRLIAAVYIVAWLLTSAASASQQLSSIEAYWQLVEETRQAVQDANSLPPDQAREILLPYAERWETITGVFGPDGSFLPLDTRYLAGALRLSSPQTERLANLLETLQAARTEYQQSQTHPDDFALLQEILEREEFQWQTNQPSAWEQWLQRLRERFLELLARLLDNKLVSRLNPILVKILYFIGPLALFLVLAYFLRGSLRSVIAESELSAATGDGDAILTADGALDRAQQLSGAGDYRQAVRYLYLSCLLLLQERGHLPHDRSRTNREYLYSLTGHPELAGLLSDVIEVFDRVWYGFQPLDDAGYTRYAKRVEELRQQR